MDRPAIRIHQFDPDPRPRIQEIREETGHQLRGDGGHRGEVQPAVASRRDGPYPLDPAVMVAHHAARHRQDLVTQSRQPVLAVALEQGRAEVPLELRERHRDGRWRPKQARGRVANGAAFRDMDKGAQGRDADHGQLLQDF